MSDGRTVGGTARQVPDAQPEAAPLRFVSAASLFDGHDAAINIIRRLLQSHGAEVVHLGHNRSVADIVRAAIQEDADGIAVSSYQGGHNEYFRYMVDMLRERGAGHIRIVVGGGGTIAPHEIAELEAYGVERIYTPEDGRKLGLDGMIEDVIRRVRLATPTGVRVRADGAARPSADRASDFCAGARRGADGAARDAAQVGRAHRRDARRCSASPAPAGRASRASPTSCCCASCAIFPIATSPSSRWIRRAGAAVARCSATGSG